MAITLPLLAVGALLTQVDFDVVWRYFSWSNQTLAMITLWAAAMYLARTRGKMVVFGTVRGAGRLYVRGILYLYPYG